MIEDSSELTQFEAFVTTGVKTTDTFNAWRKKTNGIVQLFSLLQENSADVESPVTFDYTNATIRIKTDGIKTINIENAAVTGDKIANLTITEGKLSANSVTESKIGAAAVTEAKIANNAVTENKIGTGAVTTFKIGNLAVTDTKLAANAVIESKISDAAVTTNKIANQAVTGEKIANNSIDTLKILNGAVGTANLANQAVTNAKLANNSVDTLKIIDGAVGTVNLANAAVTTAKIAADSITASKLNGSQSGDAPIYAARAYVVFKANVTADNNGTFTRTPSGTTLDGMPGHNLQVGHKVYLERTSGGSFTNGLYSVTSVLSASAFVVDYSGSASTGGARARFWTIMRSGNVSSVTRAVDNRAQFVINFTTPLPNNDYATIGSTRWYDWVFNDEGSGRSNSINSAFIRTYYNDNEKISVSFYC